MTKRNYLIFGILIGITAIAMVAYVDWMIAVGVFLAIWGNNIE